MLTPLRCSLVSEAEPPDDENVRLDTGTPVVRTLDALFAAAAAVSHVVCSDASSERTLSDCEGHPCNSSCSPVTMADFHGLPTDLCRGVLPGARDGSPASTDATETDEERMPDSMDCPSVAPSNPGVGSTVLDLFARARDDQHADVMMQLKSAKASRKYTSDLRKLKEKTRHAKVTFEFILYLFCLVCL